MGRRRMEIKKIDCLQARRVTFTKRRQGLFKKAAELSRLFNVDVAAVVFSEAGNVFEFGNTPILFDRYLTDYHRPSSSSSVDFGNRHNSSPSLLSDIQSKLSMDVSNFSLVQLEEYSCDLEKMKGDLLNCLPVKQTLTNKPEAVENSIRNEGLGSIHLEGPIDANNHVDGSMLLQDGDTADLGMGEIAFDSIWDDLMKGNGDSSGYDERFGSIPEDSWMMDWDDEAFDSVMPKGLI